MITESAYSGGESMKTNATFVLVLTGVFLAGCTGPQLRSSNLTAAEIALEGPSIPDCKNVSRSSRPKTYDRQFYRSTTFSAFNEGAQVGARTGLGVDEETDPAKRARKEYGYALMLQVFGVDGRQPWQVPYCMSFPVSEEKIAVALNRILPALGNQPVTGNEEFGLFGTEYAERSHSSAKWKDRYVISTFESTPDGRVIVKVRRDLEISRGKEAFARAYSDGNNETWVLQQIDKLVTP